MKRILLTLSAATLLIFGTVGTTAAAAPTQPIATPAKACRILTEYQAPGFQGSFGQCMTHFNKDMRAYRFYGAEGTLIDLDQRCTELENGVEDMGQYFQISYPFTFEEFPGWPFPVLTGYNHHQCEITLFTYHSLIPLLS
jgi:hypothetical protein